MQGTRDTKRISSFRNVSPAGETDTGSSPLLSERGDLGACTSSTGNSDDLGLGQMSDGDVGQL